MTQCSHLELLQLETESALNLSSQQHAGQYLKEKQEDMQESFTAKVGHNHTIYILLLCRYFYFLAISFSNISFLLQEFGLNYAILPLFLFVSKTKPFIFPLFSKIERPVSHMQIGMEIPQNNAVLKKDMQGCRGEGYSFLKRWCVVLSPWGKTCCNFSLSLLVYQSAATNTHLSCLIPCELQRVNNHSSFAEKSSWEEIHL